MFHAGVVPYSDVADLPFALVRSRSVSAWHTERIDRARSGWWAGRVAESVGVVGGESELSRLLAAVGRVASVWRAEQVLGRSGAGALS